MAKNAFDQFDTPTPSNPFDQFDSDKPAKGFASDAVNALKQGALQLPGAAAGLADIPAAALGFNRPISRAADALGDLTGFKPGQWAKDAEADYSPATQVGKAQIDAAWEDPNAGALDVAKAYAKNPRVTALNAIQSVPAMLAGGLYGRAIGGAAGVGSSAARAAIGEGSMMAGQSMAEIDPSVDPQRAAAAATAVGAGGAALGFARGRAAQRLGITDLDTAIAGGTGGAAGKAMPIYKRVPAGVVQEGVLEEAPQSAVETLAQNWAEEKPLTERLARNVTEGALAGGLMGAVGGFVPAGQRQPSVPSTPGTNGNEREQTETGAGANTGAPAGKTIAETEATAVLDSGANGGANAAAAPVIDPNAGPLSRAASIAVASSTPAADAVSVPMAPPTPTVPPLEGGQAPAAPANAATSIQGVQNGQGQEEVLKPGAGGDTLAPATASFATEDEAQAYIAQQRRAGGARIQALPMPRTDGTFGIAIKGTPDYTVAEFHKRAKELRASGVLDGDILNTKTGEPFKNRLQAGKAKREAGDGHEIVQLGESRFVVRKGAPAEAPAGVTPSTVPQPTVNQPQEKDRADQAPQAQPSAPQRAAQAPASPSVRPAEPAAAAPMASVPKERVQPASAPEPKDFTLTGSNRAVDVGAAMGQGDLLGNQPVSQPNPEPAQPTSEAVSQPETEAAPSVVRVKTLGFGDVHVRQSDLDGDRTMLPQYTADGKRKGGAIHRDNLDPDGTKLAKMNAEDSSTGVFDLIVDSDGTAFKTEVGAKRERSKRGLNESHEIVSASEVQAGANGFVIRKKTEANTPTSAKKPNTSPEPVKESAKSERVADAQTKGGFDSEAWDKERSDRIKQSRESGNVHLDTLPKFVESMRGKAITYVHDTKERGRILSVDNRGNVYVEWLDKYSQDKEMASPMNWGKRKGVMTSSLGPSDLKDYYVVADRQPAPSDPQAQEGSTGEPQAPASATTDAQPAAPAAAPVVPETGANGKEWESAPAPSRLENGNVTGENGKIPGIPAPTPAGRAMFQGFDRVEVKTTGGWKQGTVSMASGSEVTVRLDSGEDVTVPDTDVVPVATRDEDGADKPVRTIDQAANEAAPTAALTPKAQAVKEALADERQPFEHAGLKVYPTKMRRDGAVVDVWAVQLPENKGTDKVLGDTLHTTIEAAKESAEYEAKRESNRKEWERKDKEEAAKREAAKEANRGKSVAQRAADFSLNQPNKLPPSAGLGTGTRREAMDKAVEQGRAIRAETVEDTAAKNRDKKAVEAVSKAGYLLGLSNENIPVVKAGLEARARLKADKYPKIEYRVYGGRLAEGPFHTITKIEYDYAVQRQAEQLADEQARPAPGAMQNAPATHKDPGEAPEAATKAVVSEAMKTAAKNEETKPSEMRKWLLGEIDKALLNAPDRADYDEAVKRMGEKDAISMYTGNGLLGKNAETGFVTFDVPGDGKFTVRNSVRGLLEFRKNASASQGFKDNGQKPVKPDEVDGVRSGSGGRMAAIVNMIEEGDFEAARDYAEAVGISLDDVKVPKGDRKPEWDEFRKTGKVPEQKKISSDWKVTTEPHPKRANNLSRIAKLKRVVDGVEYEAIVVGETDGTAANYEITKDGKKFSAMTTRVSFNKALEMAEDAMPAANDTNGKVDGKKAKRQEAEAEKLDLKGFERIPKGNGYFDLRDGNMTVSVEPMGQGKYQASFRGAKSSPHLIGEQGAVDWAANYREESQRADAKTKDKAKPFTPPAGYKPAGEPFYRGGKLVQGYAPFAPGERVTMKDSAGQSGVVEGLIKPDDNGVFESAAVRFDNGTSQAVLLGKLEATTEKAALDATGPRRDPAKVSMFNPYQDGEVVSINGEDWTVKQETTGWYLTSDGTWRGEHPTIRGIKAMQDLIREVEQAAQDAAPAVAPAPAPAEQAAAILDAAAEPPKGKERLDVLKDVKAGAITPDEVAAAYPAAPQPSAPEASEGEEKTGVNDRDTFTLERLNRETDAMEPVTFRRGEYVQAMLVGSNTSDFGEIDGISQAKREFSVNGLWHPFGAAYKAERPASPKKDTVPLSSVVDKVNAKFGDGLGPEDAVSPLEAIKGVMRAVYDGAASVEQYQAGYRRARDAEAVKADLGKMTKPELIRMFGIMARTDEKKDSLVDTAYKSLLRGFALGKQFGPSTYMMTRGGLENYERQQAEALDAIVANHTADDLAAYAAEVKAEREERAAQRAAAAEAIKNPKTLDEYRRFMSYHTRDGKSTNEVRLSMLTPEQRAEFDLMLAEETRSRRKVTNDDQRTAVRVAGQTVDGNIIATKHTKKGHDLYVVQLAERVSREDYETLNAGAKKIGGYYSSFRGGGAIPGFQFTTREQAQAFVALAGGDATAAKDAAQGRRDAYADDRSQTAAERLTEMADRMESDADESLAMERKANTTRRARFAAAAESAAREAKAMAKTMRNVAKALTTGSAKFLDRVRTKTQVQLLQTYVANAKGDELRAKYQTYAEQEKRKGQPPTQETADYAEFPQYTAYRSDLASLARQLMEVDGAKKLGERLMKVADDVSDSFTAWAKEPGNLFKLSAFSVRSGEDVRTAIFKDRETAERSIKRSGLTGKAIVFPEKRGVNRIIMSPSEAIARGIWMGDGDKRITLTEEFGRELVEGIGRAARRGSKVSVPWQFERAYERRKQLAAMGIETPAEFRAALREFIGLREQAAEEDRIKALERAMVGKAKDGLDFFPTPESVADEMVAAAEIQPDMAVLEPSAGMGHIADRIREAGAEPEVVEMAEDRRELLQAKGYYLQPYRDFLQMEPRKFFTFGDVMRAPDGTEGIMHGGRGWSGRASLHAINEDGTEGKMLGWYDRDELVGVRHRGFRGNDAGGYDRILMNPPFSDGRDIQHVRHAYSLLKPGGRLVALMGESAFTNQNKRADEFRVWLQDVGGSEEKLAEGSFMDPSLPVNTGANARMVVIEKPGEAGNVAMFSRSPGLRAAIDRTIAAEQALDAKMGKKPGAGDDIFALSAKLTKARDALSDLLESQPNDGFAIQGRSRGLLRILHASAQKPGQWQLTRFDQKDEPWGDSQYLTKRSALEDFLREVDLDTLQDMDGVFSRSSANPLPGISLTQFNTAMADAFGKATARRLSEAGVVVPLEDQTKLPAHVVPFLREGDRVYGFYDPRTNRTYAVLSNLTPEMVKGLTLHEVGVHYGFESMLGKDKYQQVMNRLDMMAKAGQRDVKAARAEATRNAVNESQVREETLAYLVQMAPELGIIREVIAKIKAFLFRKFGIGGKYLTNDDLAMLARAAVQHAARTTDGGVRLDPAWDMAFGRDEQSPDFLFSSRSPTVWRSELMTQLEKANIKASAPEGWKAYIKGLQSKGVKPDEVEWSGINEWLDLQQGKVTKEQVLDFLDGNGVRVEEVVLGDVDTKDAAREALTDAGYFVEDDGTLSRENEDGDLEEVNGWDLETAELRDAAALVAGAPDGYAGSAGVAAPKYGQYQLPGGTNYREVLLTLPKKERSTTFAIRNRATGGLIGDFATSKEASEFLHNGPRADEFADGDFTITTVSGGKEPAYQSSHWDTPNVLAHIRVNDRVDADGKRVLFVEEVQGDWGQAGAKKEDTGPAKGFRRGFKGDGDIYSVRPSSIGTGNWEVYDTRTGVAEYGMPYRGESAAQQAAAERNSINESLRPPRAPFVTHTDKWLTLALKRIISMAANEGYEKVAFVTGEQSAERYDLSKQIGRVGWTEGGRIGKGEGWLDADDLNGKQVISKTIKKSELADHIGKEAAQRLLDSQPMKPPGEGDARYELSGLDLKVGGEGMKAFYDKIIPNTLKDVLKKVGGGGLETVDIGIKERRIEGEQETPNGKPLGIVEHPRNGMLTIELDDGSYWGLYASSQGAAESRAQAEREFARISKAYREKTILQPGFTITPQMKEAAFNGMPLFARRFSSLKGNRPVASYVDATPRQKATLDAIDEGPESTDFDLLPAKEDINTSADSNFTDWEQDRGIKYVPLAMLGPFSGYDNAKDTARIRRLADAIKESNTFEPIFVGIDPNGEAYVMEGQHRVRALELLGETHVPAQVIVSMDGTEDDYSAQPDEPVQAKTDYRSAEGQGVLFARSQPFSRDQENGLPATIEVDGVQRPTTNSKGQPIHPTEEGVRNFWRWFAGSRVVDADGKPLRVYHGTNADFSEFNTTGGSDKFANNKLGAFFAADPDMAQYGRAQMPVYLSIKNPYVAKLSEWAHWQNTASAAEVEAKRAQLIDGGHDGVTDGMGVYVAFRPEQIKSALGNTGAFNPANPDIRFARGAPDLGAVVTDIKRQAGNRLTDYRSLGLGLLGRRQLVDLYEGDLPQLRTYSNLVQRMDADKNEAGAEADELARRWGALKDEKALAELMHDSTLAQIDPTMARPRSDLAGDQTKYDQLREQFMALTPQAQAVYKDARDAYKRHHQKVRAAIRVRVLRSQLAGARKAEILARLDAEFFEAVKGVYFPLARFGDYVVLVRDNSGRVMSVNRAETMTEAEALRDHLRKEYPDMSVSKVLKDREFNAGRDSVGRGFMETLFAAFDHQDLSAAQRADIEDMLGQLYLSALPDLSWAKHGIHRKGTPGYSQDARRAFAMNMFHGARYLAKTRYSDLLEGELSAMQKHVAARSDDDRYDSVRAQQVVDEMVKRHDSMMNPKTNALSTALTSVGFVFHLGLSPASAMVNLSQTALVAYPLMGAKWGYGKASAALLKASAEAAKFKNDLGGALKGDEKKAFDEAVRAGTIDVTMAHDLAGIAQGEDAKVAWKIRPVMRMASFLFHHAERFNRQVTFLAAYRLAREAGADHVDAYEQATQATYDGHFDYAASNRPRHMQGNVAKVLLLFKQYAQNMIYTMVRQADLSVNGTPAQKAEARKALAGLLAMHAAAAGVLGLPLVSPLLSVASMIGGDDDEPWDAEVALRNMLADSIGAKPAEVLTRGFSRLTPWDISARVGLDHLILPDVQEGLQGRRFVESAAVAFMGPVAGIGLNIGQGMQDIAQGHWLRGIETMMPTAIRGPLRAVRYANEGAIDKTGVPIVDEVGAAGIVGQALGLRPSTVALAQEGKSAIYEADQRLVRRRSELMREFAVAVIEGDFEGASNAREDIRAFNEKNPGRRINPLQLAASVRARRLRIDQADQGVYLPKNRRDAAEAGRFALTE